jgi:hypothetical protein
MAYPVGRASMRIVTIGGGPAGLYFALLMKKLRPEHRITVVERNRPYDTFGWGVVFPVTVSSASAARSSSTSCSGGVKASASSSCSSARSRATSSLRMPI